ncbi:PepSY domain-containing protein [Robertmurraya korlensis]|uniref:PepSY domain-containing protein n=1 Tax=Robertmurraya korlensis TaxID=519977 RepID=UPI00203EF763|nr:PepSY domain-containing protein [Robertmurraya korlensis]MCM3601375.1 PepSY domain-containing protein [Robertmurraya korlensis]
MKKRNALLIGIVSFVVLAGAIGVGAIDKIEDDSKKIVTDVVKTSPSTGPIQTNVKTDDSSSVTSQEAKITKDEAIAVALKESPGTVTKVELDDDYTYEIEIRDGDKEMDYEIDAMTGEIREMDTDFFDDRDDD